MPDDSIIVRLGLPELRILEQWELENYFQVKVAYRRSEANCPKCGKVTTKVHDQRLQHKKDRGLRDKIVLLKLLKRRFRCPFCRKVFTEPDEVFGLRRRSSRRFRAYLGREALQQTVRRVAQKERVGEGLVRRCVAEEIGRMLKVRGVKETVEFIGLDEFSVRKGRIFHTTLCNLLTREIIEVVEGQGRKKVEAYLEKMPHPEKVKGVVMARHEPFRQAVYHCLPWTKIIVDKFHLLRHINEALDKVRSRLCRLSIHLTPFMQIKLTPFFT